MLNHLESYEVAKSRKDELYYEWKEANNSLQYKLKKNGLVKSSEEYKIESEKVKIAFIDMKNFEENFNKIFQEEIKSEAIKMKKNLARYKVILMGKL
jgi:hypothetical protein